MSSAQIAPSDIAASQMPATADPLEHVPECLRARPQWVCWRYATRKGKRTKIPYDARTGCEASSTDPATWCSFEQAVATQIRDGYAGVGYVFAEDDPYCGVDLDDSIDTDTGELKPWAQIIVDHLDTYCETSPSWWGVKLFLIATKPGTRCRKPFQDGEVEIYDHGRFFTVTGQRLAGPSPAVEQRQEALNHVYGTVFGDEQPLLAMTTQSGGDSPPPIAPPTPASSSAVQSAAPGTGLADEQIIEKATRSRKSGVKFANLLAGKWQVHFRSQSEADSSLIFTLAFYTKEAGQLDRLFRASKLMRSKWDEQHGPKTYGQITIDKALEKVTGQWRPRHPTKRNNAASAPDCAAKDGDAAAPHDSGSDDGPREGGGNGPIALGQREPETGRLVLSPKRTLPTAVAFVGQFHGHPDNRRLHSYAGTLLAWRGNRFVEVEEESFRQQLQPWLHDALRYQYNPRTKETELVDFESNPGTVKAALESLRAYVHLPVSITPPCWLDGSAKGRPDPRALLAFPSGTLDLTSGRVMAPTPALFNINAIEFDYVPTPAPPTRWLAFLAQLWEDDPESVELLQEWMGYCLVADTAQQKMLLMVGPKRSGKGTIGRVLTRLVGAGNVVGPTTSSLAGTFGLQPLIGKSLAIVSDARFGGEHIGVLVERLLCISGEDTLTVDRKFLGSVTMTLPTRFVFLTNELPRMNDASGALAGQFVILRLMRSFYGEEDTSLTPQLMRELPGILVWAIEGLRRLRARGHFVQPAAVCDAVREMEDLASPVMAFVRDRCAVGVGRRTWIDEMYAAWKSWCVADGRDMVTSKQVFGRDLAAAVPGVICRRHSIQGRFYDGIALGAGDVP